MDCSYHAAGLCRSCTQLNLPYGQQLAKKDQHARSLLAAYPDLMWLEPLASAPSGFRNKAKLVVSGTADQPRLGIAGQSGQGVDLSDCPLYLPALQAMLPTFKTLIRRAHLTPYGIKTGKGELKNIIVTVAVDGAAMVRFVLRSKKLVVAIRQQLAWLQSEITGLKVVSINILREHVALLEGSEEFVLTDTSALPMPLGDLNLYLQPQSFFQTNTALAQALYRQAQTWFLELEPRRVWDLYCGVGGFAIFAARTLGQQAEVTGVELSQQAIASARRTAAELELSNITFKQGDATDFVLDAAGAGLKPAQMLVLNPPRRGVSAQLTCWLEQSGVETVIYSSCNALTLQRDLQLLPSYRPVQARVLDMFAQSHHYEVITLLRRRSCLK